MLNESKHTKAFLISGLVFVLLFVHLPVVYTLFYHNLTGTPEAVSGSIDLTMVSPDRPIILDGTWEFYWHRLIASEERQNVKPDFLIRVPDYWSNYKTGGSWLPAGGFGSYRLTLKGLDYPNPVTIYIPDFGSAYRVFIDGVLTAESGSVSKDPGNVFTVPQPQLYPVTLSKGDEHEVVIEVATVRFSGLYKAPELKDYGRAIEEGINKTGILFILFGTVLFSFFIIVIIKMMSIRKNIRFMWLPVMCVLVILRIMLTNEFYSFWQGRVFFNLSYEATNELMFFVTFALKYLLIYLVQEQFAVPFSRKEKYGFSIYYVALYLIYLFTPYEIYNRYLTILLPASSFAVEIYCFIKIYSGRKRMENFGIITYWGIVLAISGLSIDCYYINGSIYPDMSLALLILLSACLMIMSLVSALRIMEVYRDLAVSSFKLEQARNHIAIQKKYYDALNEQMNEIRGIKHDIRHFIGVIGRMCEEGLHDELKQFLGEYAQKIEIDQIPFFCDNVVANSILGYYSLKARKGGIPFHCACSIPKQLPVNDIDLCIVLGNAMENAIEACSSLDNPDERFMSIEVRVINNHLLIKIENSYNGYLNFHDGNYISTKNEKPGGIGIQNIKKVVETYGGFIKIGHNDKVFTLMAAFPLHARQGNGEPGHDSSASDGQGKQSQTQRGSSNSDEQGKQGQTRSGSSSY